jgi:hypothetical protein
VLSAKKVAKRQEQGMEGQTFNDCELALSKFMVVGIGR